MITVAHSVVRGHKEPIFQYFPHSYGIIFFCSNTQKSLFTGWRSAGYNGFWACSQWKKRCLVDDFNQCEWLQYFLDAGLHEIDKYLIIVLMFLPEADNGPSWQCPLLKYTVMVSRMVFFSSRYFWLQLTNFMMYLQFQWFLWWTCNRCRILSSQPEWKPEGRDGALLT